MSPDEASRAEELHAESVRRQARADRYWTAEQNRTGWFVGVSVALALIATGYMIFSAADVSTCVRTEPREAIREIRLPNGVRSYENVRFNACVEFGASMALEHGK